MKKPGEQVLTKEKRSYSHIFRDQRMLLLMVIIAIFIVVSIINPNFIGINNLIAIFGQISVGGVLAMAMAMLLLTGVIDLSIGNIMALSGCTMATLIVGNTEGTMSGTAAAGEAAKSMLTSDTGITSIPVAILIGVLVAIACGALNGFIVAKSKCMPLIITLGMSFVYKGLALIITSGRVMAFKLAFEPLRLLRIGGLVPSTLLIFIAVVVASYVIINRTRYGRRLVAIGGNEQNARLSGINVDRYKISIYAIGGLYCAIALIIFASRLDAIKSTSGDNFNMWALVAPIIGGVTFDGGRGSIIGAFLGAFFMGIVQNAMGIMNVSPYIQVMVNGIIIVLAVVLSNLQNIRKQ